MNLKPYWEYLQEVSTQRLANNQTVWHIQNDGRLEIIGAAGELAARLFFGMSSELGTHFDQGSDFLVGDLKVDVKATPLTPGAAYRFLQWPERKPVKADIIVMTIVNIEEQGATLVGYTTRKAIKAAPVNVARRTPCHEIAYSRLSPLWELAVHADLKRKGVLCETVGSLHLPA